MTFNYPLFFSPIRLLGILILLTPLFNIGEILNIFLHYTDNIKDSITPFELKGVKDILLIYITLLLLILHYQKGIINYNTLILSSLCLLSIPSLLYMVITEPIYFLSGMRWGMPLVMTLLLVSIIQETSLKELWKSISILLIIHFMIQLVQFFYINTFGYNQLGFSLRNPGIFLMPNTAGLFSIFTIIFILYLNKFEYIPKYYYWITSLSVYLSGSSTAILLLCLIGFIYFLKNHLFTVLILLPIPLFISYLLLNFMRPEVFDESFMPRLDLLVKNLNSSNLFIGDFGMATNTATSIMHSFELSLDQIVSADSFWGSLPINVGLLVFLIIFFLNIIFISIGLIQKKFRVFILFLSIFLYGFTSSIVEAHPTNILIAVLLAYTFKTTSIRVNSYS